MNNKDQKKKRKISPTRYNLERATYSHALILALVGAYLVFMVYMIVQNYINGETSMKLSTEIIVVVAMCAGCAICFGYAIYIFYIVRNKERIGQEQDREMGYVDEYGNPIDEYGNPIDENGNPIYREDSPAEEKVYFLNGDSDDESGSADESGFTDGSGSEESGEVDDGYEPPGESDKDDIFSE